MMIDANTHQRDGWTGVQGWMEKKPKVWSTSANSRGQNEPISLFCVKFYKLTRSLSPQQFQKMCAVSTLSYYEIFWLPIAWTNFTHNNKKCDLCSLFIIMEHIIQYQYFILVWIVPLKLSSFSLTHLRPPQALKHSSLLFGLDWAVINFAAHHQCWEDHTGMQSSSSPLQDHNPSSFHLTLQIFQVSWLTPVKVSWGFVQDSHFNHTHQMDSWICNIFEYHSYCSV